MATTGKGTGAAKGTTGAKGSGAGRMAVVAIGGNSLILDEKHKTIPDQYLASVETCKHIAAMIEMGWNVVVTHGNGPQVGFILRRSEMARSELHDVPLEYCVADSQGGIGYTLERALLNVFRERGLKHDVVTIMTTVVVDRDDPAFKNPTKPIGSFMTKEEAHNRHASDGWDVKEDAGRGWRRVVASPLPIEIIEQRPIETLVRSGAIVIAVGGGGIPVLRDAKGDIDGVAAVIDKDFASSLLARSMKADLLLISTGVEQVALNFKKPDQKNLARLTLAEARKYYAEGHFAAGSMGPKIKAAMEYLEGGGKEALITTPFAIERALAGETGTWIVRE